MQENFMLQTHVPCKVHTSVVSAQPLTCVYCGLFLNSYSFFAALLSLLLFSPSTAFSLLFSTICLSAISIQSCEQIWVSTLLEKLKVFWHQCSKFFCYSHQYFRFLFIVNLAHLGLRLTWFRICFGFLLLIDGISTFSLLFSNFCSSMAWFRTTNFIFHFDQFRVSIFSLLFLIYFWIECRSLEEDGCSRRFAKQPYDWVSFFLIFLVPRFESLTQSTVWMIYSNLLAVY